MNIDAEHLNFRVLYINVHIYIYLEVISVLFILIDLVYQHNYSRENIVRILLQDGKSKNHTFFINLKADNISSSINQNMLLIYQLTKSN